MTKLVESIIHNDLLTASEIFEAQIAEIMEKKLYEKKRMMQSEVFGGRTIAQAKKDIESKGMTPRRASDVYADPVKAPKSSELKGNTPTAMYKRLKSYLGKKKTEIMKKEPAAPGSAVVGATKAVGRLAGNVIPAALGRVAGEISSYSNLEE